MPSGCFNSPTPHMLDLCQTRGKDVWDTQAEQNIGALQLPEQRKLLLCNKPKSLWPFLR